MKAPTRVSLRFSVAGLLVGVVVATSLLLGATTYGIWSRSLREDLGTRLRELAATSALLVDASVHAALRQPDDMRTQAYQGLRERLTAVRERVPQIHFLYTFRWTPDEPAPRFVLDTGTGDQFSPLGLAYKSMPPSLRAAFQPPYRVIVEHDFYADEYGTFLSAYAPVLTADGRLEAVLGVDLDASGVVAIERRLLLLVAGLTLAIALIMTLGAVWLSRWFSRPMRALSDEMTRIQRLDLDGSVDVRSRISEIAELKDGVDNMKRGLRSFRRYVPADLVTQLIAMKKEATLGTEKAEVTIFFCDLANFTSASEKLSGEELAFLLSGYFSLVTRSLQAEGATIDKFIGDAVMAFWNAPEARADHAVRAVRAALAVQAGLEALLASWKARGLPALGVRMGLNTGVVQVGNVGHDERLSYTVLGDPVNLASRLEGLNKLYGTTVLASEATLRALGDVIAWRPVDVVAVKGKSEAITVGEPALLPPAWWGAYRAAWSLYRARKWAEAADALEAVRDEAGDQVAATLAARCRGCLDGTLAGFDGTWVMHEK